MIIDLILGIAVYGCINVTIINHTNVWNEADANTLKRCSDRCVLHYPDAPCLKTFVKYKENSYAAVCGEESK